jgi:hypothetical protein
MANIKNRLKKKYKIFNDVFSDKIVIILATMECAYAFVLLSVLPLLDKPQETNILYLSNCFQLVFLPIIMFSAKRDAQRLSVQQKEDHDELKEMYEDIKDMHIKIFSANINMVNYNASGDQ